MIWWLGCYIRSLNYGIVREANWGPFSRVPSGRLKLTGDRYFLIVCYYAGCPFAI
jgi:hypothetical protein